LLHFFKEVSCPEKESASGTKAAFEACKFVSCGLLMKVFAERVTYPASVDKQARRKFFAQMPDK